MDGYITIGTKLDESGVDKGITHMRRNLENEVSNLEKSVNSKMSSLENSVTKILGLMKASIIGVGLAMLFKQITGSINDAISRLDTLNNYTKVMSNLGISAKDASDSIKYLSDKLIGLPTTLDDAVMSVQRFTSANSNVKASTEMFLALNNAILAGGTSAQVQSSALEQLSQAYAKGKPDMMEWRTAMMAMPAQLKQVAIAMGYVSADELGEALRNGTVSMNEFMKTLMKLNKEGINGFSSFEEQARNATGGVATSMTNVKTAITRGLAEIMNAIGQSNIAGFFQGIARAINSVIPYIVAFIKLIMTAVSFVSRLFGGGAKKDIENTGTAIGGTTGAMNNLGESAEDTAGSMDNATGSAKKLKNELKQIAKFDELDVLKDNSSSGSGGGTAGAGGTDLGNFDFGDFDTDIGNAVSKADELVNKVKEIAKAVGDLLSQGFMLSWEDTNFNGIKKEIEGIKTSLSAIFTDKNVINAMKNFGKTFLITIGEIAGAIARIGTNIAEGLFGSINNYLARNRTRIRNFLVDVFNIRSEDLKIVGAFSRALGQISDVIKGDTAKNIGSNLLTIFVNPIMSATELFLKFSRDIKQLLFQPIIDNVELIKTTLENDFTVIQNITNTLAEVFTFVGDKWNVVYDEHIKPFLDDLKNGISDSLSKFLESYNKYVYPTLQKMAYIFDDTWNSHLKPFLNNVMNLIGTIYDDLKEFWNDILKPLIDWIVANILPIILPIIESVFKNFMSSINGMIDGISKMIKALNLILTFLKNFLAVWSDGFSKMKTVLKNTVNTMKQIIISDINTVKNNISNSFTNIKNNIYSIWNSVLEKTINVWSNIRDRVKEGANGAWEAITSRFSGIAEWFRDVFSEAWQNVKDVFSSGGNVFEGIQEGILDSLVTIINGLIAGINNVISSAFSGLNNSLRKIKNVNILGAQPFSSIQTINVPQIPYLKTGGIINMPNKGRLIGSAIGGESGREGVLPLTDRQAMSELGYEIGKNVVVNLTNITEMNGRVIGRELKNIQNQQDFAFNN